MNVTIIKNNVPGFTLNNDSNISKICYFHYHSIVLYFKENDDNVNILGLFPITCLIPIFHKNSYTSHSVIDVHERENILNKIRNPLILSLKKSIR